MDYYILDENDEVQKFATMDEMMANGGEKFKEFSKLMMQKKRVALDLIGDYTVSTVFLAIDHSWGGRPVLFETMIFNPKDIELDGYQERYSNKADALKGHDFAVAMVKANLKKMPWKYFKYLITGWMLKKRLWK